MRNQNNPIVLLLGSNISPEYYLPRAVELLATRLQIQRVSSVWETSAIGSNGPHFLNAAVLLESNFFPQVMKEFILRPMEASLGRVRIGDKNAPRTIDLDIVIFGEHTWDGDIWQYAHAAVPVAELVPNFRHHAYQETLAQVSHKLKKETEISLQADITQKVQSLFEFTIPRPSIRTRIPLHLG